MNHGLKGQPALLAGAAIFSIVGGLLLLFWPTMVIWLVSAATALALIVVQYRKSGGDPLAPAVAFPSAYLGFFLVGSLNLYDGPTKHLLLQSIPPTIWFYAGIGLVAFLAGNRFGAVFASKTSPVSSVFSLTSGPAMKVGVLVCLFVGSTALVLVHLTYGLPIFNMAVRTEVSGYLSYLSYLVWAGLLLLVGHLRRLPELTSSMKYRFVFLSAISVAAGSTVLLAYRTPVVMVVLSFAFLYHMRVRKLTLRAIALCVTAILVLSTLFAVLRTTIIEGQTYIDLFYSMRTGKGISAYALPLQVLYWNICRESVANFNALLQIVPSDYPYLHGDALGGSLLSILPGKQITAREYVGILIYGQAHSTLTPTILGPFYLDFGIGGIVVGMMFVGGLLGWLYVRRERSQLAGVLYVYWLALALVSIHAGLADPGYYLFLPCLLVLVTYVATLPSLVVRNDIERGVPSGEAVSP